jgi:hypothetical protein
MQPIVQIAKKVPLSNTLLNHQGMHRKFKIKKYNSSFDGTLTTCIMWFNFCSNIVFFKGHDDDMYRLIGPSSVVACDFLDSQTNIYDLANNVWTDATTS